MLIYSASATGQTNDQAQVRLTKTGVDKADWQLQVSHTPLSQVLQEIQKVSGLRIHFSVLPQQEVSATCVDDELTLILKCLLGDSVNLVFNGSGNASDPTSMGEVWLLGSTLSTQRSAVDCNPPRLSDAVAKQTAQDRNIDQLLLDVNADDTRQRADAVFDLAKQSDVDPIEVDAVLLNGLNDPSAMVRGQALSGWAGRHGDAALPELQQAMLDTDSSVRLQAVELTDNSLLLNNALQDADALVRQLAEAKLQALRPR
ncbi:HEAT repeat domain-containing protein [Methylicorpusculum sp.]|uniref:HEAT repeat domain-containing protein n=1 Tax=Methylicorpusculum sp. TaxID=2713644 RepID=UPI0027304327|nr:hypothetical protein [Methylicorpusculum sp.]MDP2180384.1 hypothetical protein [Methylicorpusculum sp.]MDP3527918.1 hypothetical protein [Methylicorpusculum sp.]